MLPNAVVLDSVLNIPLERACCLFLQVFFGSLAATIGQEQTFRRF